MKSFTSAGHRGKAAFDFAAEPIQLVGTTDVMYDDVIIIMRTIVDLPSDQIAALSEFCKSQNISRAEAVRRALAQMLERRSGENREKAFGAWRKKKLESADYIRKIRDEWES